MKLIILFSFIIAFSGCSKLGPEFGLWGGGRVNPSGVNQIFDGEFEKIDLITLLDPKGKAKEDFLVGKIIRTEVARRRVKDAKINATTAATAATNARQVANAAKNDKKLESDAITSETKASEAKMKVVEAKAKLKAAEAKEGITWEELTDQEKLDRTFEAFYHDDYAEDGKRRRNAIQERILAASDNRCNLYKAYMKNLNTRTNFMMGATTTILGGAGAIVGGAAARTYAGAAGVVSGVRSEFDQAYYSKKAFGLVATGIDRRREELHGKMKEKRGDDITVYTVQEAVRDVILYHGACSMDSGLDEAAKNMQIDYNFGIKQVEGTIKHVKKAAEFAKEIEAIDKKAEAASKIIIENSILTKPKKLEITVRNGGDTEFTVDKIYVNKKAFPITAIKISPEKTGKIELDLSEDLSPGYKIKVATTTGLTSEYSDKK